MTHRAWPSPADPADPSDLLARMAGGGPSPGRTYRVHYPGWHGSLEDLEEDDDLSGTCDEVEAGSAEYAAEDWVEERFSDLDYPDCVEGLIVTAPDGTVTAWSVTMEMRPHFSGHKSSEEAP